MAAKGRETQIYMFEEYRNMKIKEDDDEFKKYMSDLIREVFKSHLDLRGVVMHSSKRLDRLERVVFENG